MPNTNSMEIFLQSRDAPAGEWSSSGFHGGSGGTDLAWVLREGSGTVERDIDGLSPVAKARSPKAKTPLIPVQCSVILMIWMFILVTKIGRPRRQTEGMVAL
jgi:hypothetical protein